MTDSKAKIWTLSSRGMGVLIDRLKEIFVLQTLLPNNKRYWHRSRIRSIFINTIKRLRKHPIQRKKSLRRFLIKRLIKTKTKDAITYVRSNSADTAYLALQELTVRVAKDPYSKPKHISKVVFDGRLGRYEFDLLCRIDPAEHITYTCSAFDQWQIEAAIMSMLQDKSSPLYHNYLQPRVVISKILATLGYNLPVKQETQQQSTVVSHQGQEVYVPSSQIEKILYKHCGDCHANRSDEHSFLDVNDAQALCANILRYINSVELQNSERDIIYALTSNWMPPSDSAYATEFSQNERNTLIDALKKNKLPFANSFIWRKKPTSKVNETVGNDCWLTI